MYFPIKISSVFLLWTHIPQPSLTPRTSKPAPISGGNLVNSALLAFSSGFRSTAIVTEGAEVGGERGNLWEVRYRDGASRLRCPPPREPRRVPAEVRRSVNQQHLWSALAFNYRCSRTRGDGGSPTMWGDTVGTMYHRHAFVYYPQQRGGWGWGGY